MSPKHQKPPGGDRNAPARVDPGTLAESGASNTPALDQPTLRAGAVIAGRYRVERHLASGGMGQVFAAHDLRSDRLVALKVMSGEAPTAEASARFAIEARATSTLSHPGIVAVLDAGADQGRQYLVTELLEGRTVRELLAAGPISLPAALDLGVQLSRALAAAHAHGVIHRDLKPGNLFVTRQGALKILDFGIAKLTRREQGAPEVIALTEEGKPIGTAAYMAPEQVRAEAVDERADVFAFGVVLHELFTGERAFHGPSRVEIGYAVLTGDPKLPAHVPIAVRRVIERCLRKKREERFADGEELRDAFAAAAAAVAAAPTGPWTRWPWPATFAAAVVLVCLVAGIAQRHATPVELPAAVASPSRVVVFPFRIRGSPGLEWLSQGMVDLIASPLLGSGARAADPASSIRAAAGETGADLESARSHARDMSASHFVTGTLFGSGPRVRLDARLYAVTGRLEPLLEVSLEGGLSEIQPLAAALAERLAPLVGGISAPTQGPGGRLGRLGQESIKSIEALRAYLEGEAILRSGQWPEAIEPLQRAVELEPRFAFGHYRLAVASNTTRPDVAGPALAAALRLADRLAPRDRALIEAYAALMDGRAALAEQRYRALLAEHPDDVEAWEQLGETIFHYNALRGRSPAEAEEAFSKALVFDPGNGHCLGHLLDVALIRGQRDVALAHAERAATRPGAPIEQRMVARWLRAWADDDGAARLQILAEIARPEMPRRVRYQIFYRSLWLDDGFAAARAVAELLTRSPQPAERAKGEVSKAMIELARGRPRAAHAIFTEAAARGDEDNNYLHAAAAIAALPFVPLPAEDRPAALAEAASLDESTPRRAAQKAAALGFLAAKTGHVELALVSAAKVAAFTDLPGSAAADLSLAIRATLEDALGHPAAALALLEKMELRIPYRDHESFTRLPQQLLRARLLEAAGRTDEALGQLSAFVFYGDHAPGFVAPALLARARIFEKRGDRTTAAALRSRAAALWSEAEPALKVQLGDLPRVR